MPVFEQGYRPYTGPVRRGSRALAIAWESLRPRLRWFVWVLALMFTFWPYVVCAVLVYVVTMTDAGATLAAVKPSDVAFQEMSTMELSRVLGFLSADSTAYWWEVLMSEALVGGFVLLPAIACAGILASDRRTGALQIYLARPVTRGDYVLGKLLATAAFPALVTVVPALLLWGLVSLLSKDPAHVLRTWSAPFGIVSASLVYSLWASSVVLALSSVISRPALVAIATVFVHLFLSGLGGMLSGVFREKAWLCLSPPFALAGATTPFFGMSLPDWLPYWACLPHAVVVPALCLLLVVHRVRAVEVAT